MAGPKKLDSERMTVVDLWEEALFTKLVIQNTPETKALIPIADAGYTETQGLLDKERKLREGLVDGDVQVSIGNRSLDDGVAGFRAVVNQKTDSDSSAPLHQRFFSKLRPSEVIRMSLSAELLVVEPWLASLKADADADLAAQGASLEKLVLSGKAALKAQGDARQAQKDLRAGAREATFEAVNKSRAMLYGELSKLSQEPSFVESFFRPSPKRASEEPALLTVAEATAQLDARRAEVIRAEAELAAAQQREADAKVQSEAQAKKRQELETKRKSAEALRLEIAKIESELAA